MALKETEIVEVTASLVHKDGLTHTTYLFASLRPWNSAVASATLHASIDTQTATRTKLAN